MPKTTEIVHLKDLWDEKQAAEWFRRAAERGYVDSAFDLALLYERGLGVPQDMKQALTWYGIAAQAGDVPAAERVVALQNQISRQAAVLAAFAAKNFTPLTPLGATMVSAEGACAAYYSYGRHLDKQKAEKAAQAQLGGVA